MMMFLLTTAMAIAALTGLSLTMDRHSKVVLGFALGANHKRVVRIVSWLLLALGLTASGDGYGVVSALGAITVAALLLSLTFAYQPDRFFPIVGGVAVVCVSLFFWMTLPESYWAVIAIG